MGVFLGDHWKSMSCLLYSSCTLKSSEVKTAWETIRSLVLSNNHSSCTLQSSEGKIKDCIGDCQKSVLSNIAAVNCKAGEGITVHGRPPEDTSLCLGYVHIAKQGKKDYMGD